MRNNKNAKFEIILEIQLSTLFTLWNLLFQQNCQQQISISIILTMEDPEKWYQIVKKVDQANLHQREQLNFRNKQRYKMYIDDLKQQMKEHQMNNRLLRKMKTIQRADMQKAVHSQKEHLSSSKIEKVKTQQKYQAANLELYQNKNTQTKQKSPQQQSPFDRLVEMQDERLRLTRKKFIEQNSLNEIQINLKKKKREEQLEQDKRERKQYEQFVENSFKKQDESRRKIKFKFMGNKNKNSVGPNSDIHMQYKNFLDDQVQEQKKNRFVDKQIVNERQKPIHSHAQNGNSSPAYLGRDMQQSDRLQQLKILDKSLLVGRNKSRNFTEESPERKSIRADYETLKYKNDPQVSTTNRQEDLSLPSIKLNSEIGSSYSPIKYSQDGGYSNKKMVRARKQFKQYDFISGRSKSIFI